MDELNRFLLFCASYPWATMLLCCSFIAATYLRLRHLRELESRESRSLERLEEESVLARRTLDFAWVPDEAGTDRPEFTHMPEAPPPPDGPPPPPPPAEAASAPPPPPPPESVPPAPTEAAAGLEDLPALDGLEGLPDPDELIASQSAPPPPAESAPPRRSPLEVAGVEPEGPTEFTLHEHLQRFETLRAELLLGNRQVLDDLDQLADKQAIEEAEANLAEDPENFNLLDWLAFMYYQNDMVDRAIEAYKKLISRKPDSPDLFLALGKCFYKVNLLPEARYCWDTVLVLEPHEKVRSQAEACIENAQGLMGQWEQYGIVQPITDRFIQFLVEQEPTGEVAAAPSDDAVALPAGDVEVSEDPAATSEPPAVPDAPPEEGELVEAAPAPEADLVPAEPDADAALVPAAEAPPDESAAEEPPAEEIPEDGEWASPELEEAFPAPEPEAAEEDAVAAAELADEVSPDDPLDEPAPDAVPEAELEGELDEEALLEADVIEQAEAMLAAQAASEATPVPGDAAAATPDAEVPGDEELPPAAEDALALAEDEPLPAAEELPSAAEEAVGAAEEDSIPVAEGVPPVAEEIPEEAPPPAIEEATVSPVAVTVVADAPGEPPPAVEVPADAPPPAAVPAGDVGVPLQVRFDEADALQSAFHELFVPVAEEAPPVDPAPVEEVAEAAPEPSLADDDRVASLLQLEAARQDGTMPERLELLESTSVEVRAQTTHALAYANPDVLPTLVEAEDPEVRFAAALGLLAGSGSAPVTPLLAAFEADPPRGWAYLALLERDLGPEGLGHLLARLTEEPPLPASTDLWELCLSHVDGEDLDALLELLISRRIAPGLAAASHLAGLGALQELFPALDAEGLHEGFRDARTLFPDRPRPSRSLNRSLAEAEPRAFYQLLLDETLDRLVEALELDDLAPEDLVASLPGFLGLPARLLLAFARCEDPPPPEELGILPLAAHLRVASPGFYMELAGNAAEGASSWLEVARLGRADLLDLLSHSPALEEGLSQLVQEEGAGSVLAATWILRAPLARAPTELLDLVSAGGVHLHSRAALLSAREGAGDPASLDAPGWIDWRLRRGLEESALAELLAERPEEAWPACERLGVLGAAAHLAESGEPPAEAPGLRALALRLAEPEPEPEPEPELDPETPEEAVVEAAEEPPAEEDEPEVQEVAQEAEDLVPEEGEEAPGGEPGETATKPPPALGVRLQNAPRPSLGYRWRR